MASKKDVVRIVDEDYESKSFKTAPSGRYSFTINKAQSKVVPGNESNILRLVATIKKGPHKGVNVFDNIAAHVGWKIAQVLLGLGYSKDRIKKLAKAGKLTLQEVLKIAAGKDIDAVIRETNSEEFGKQNKVVQYLPPGSKADADDDEDEEEDEDEDEDLDEDDLDDDEDEEEDDEDEDDEDEDEDEDEDDEDEDEEEDEDDEDEEDEEDDDEEEDEDEDDEPPARKKPVAKKAAAKKTVTKKKGR